MIKPQKSYAGCLMYNRTETKVEFYIAGNYIFLILKLYSILGRLILF